MERIDVTSDSAGTACAAWLYRSEGAAPHPAIDFLVRSLRVADRVP